MAKPDLMKDTIFFVRWHLGRDCFAPHTGQDLPAWRAFVHLMQCWTHGGGESALNAMEQTILCAQPIYSVLRTFVQVIPALGEWSHVQQIWPRVVDPLHGRWLLATHGKGDGDPRAIQARERTCDYDAKNKPIPGTDRYREYGWRATHTPTLHVVP